MATEVRPNERGRKDGQSGLPLFPKSIPIGGGEGSNFHSRPGGRPSRVSLIDRKSDVQGESVDLGGRRIIKKKKGEKTVNLFYNFSQNRSQSGVAKDRISIHGGGAGHRGFH